MTSLRYPLDIDGAADYITFTPVRYRSNRQNQRDPAGAPAPNGAARVALYMPNSTPAVSNNNQWGDTGNNLQGPLGDVRRSIGETAVDMALGVQNGASVGGNIEQAVKTLGRAMGKGIKAAAGGDLNTAGAQFLLEKIPQELTGATPLQLMSISRGMVYNPNIELFYTMPKMRSYDFTFKFIPKNSAETLTINNIIRNFKRWSAPEDLNNGMFEIPMVWDIKYKTGAGDNQNMNLFKRAACVDVRVQANPQTQMHVSHRDGMPVETVMTVAFREVDIITRNDHEEGTQGF